jgi:predicted phosphodiesterase
MRKPLLLLGIFILSLATMSLVLSGIRELVRREVMISRPRLSLGVIENSPGITTTTSGAFPTPFQPDTVIQFAVIGDYGYGSKNEARVAELVNSWNPDFVITTGDNNYPYGGANTIDNHIGQFYYQYIGNYQGSWGPGSEGNRFWPSLGNHDWYSIDCSNHDCKGAYFDYFTLPGNERYYDVDYGLVHLFALDSYREEPDGVDSDSTQADWLRDALGSSKACFDLVYLHYPPYSSGVHASSPKLRWPYQEWGADVVLAGHDHSYERLDANGFPYFVNGSGGRNLRDFPNINMLPPGVISLVRYNEDYGAMLISAHSKGIFFQFYNASNELIDLWSISKDCQAIVSASTPQP